MKKINNNNKFRGNTIYSLNYKFDSVSSAGKLSGTALDLIKKYNELAKEAHNNGDYVQMEVFRQYAEHYRKIVTEINERKNQNKENAAEQNNAQASEQSAEKTAEAQPAENNSAETPENNNLVETEAAAPHDAAETEEKKTVEKPKRRRSFTVVDVSAKENDAAAETSVSSEEPQAKPRRRVIHRRTAEQPAETTAENA